MSKVTIEAVDNGYIVTKEGLINRTRVFPRIENALTEVYQSVARDWSVGDVVKIIPDK